MLTLQVCSCESVYNHNQSLRPNATDMLHASTSAEGQQSEDLPCLAGRLARGFCKRVFDMCKSIILDDSCWHKKWLSSSAVQRGDGSEKPKPQAESWLGFCRDKMAVQKRHCHFFPFLIRTSLNNIPYISIYIYIYISYIYIYIYIYTPMSSRACV